MKVKAFAIVAAVAALAATVGACGGGDDSGSASSGGPAKGTMTLWARDTQKLFMTQLADAYNKAHKAQVKVSIIPTAQFVQKFGTAAASGNAPDIASIDLVYLPYFASQGALADITKLHDGLSYKDDLSPAHSKLAQYEGKTYALPFTAEASVLYWNKALFRKAGLPNKPPSNYAEMMDAAKKIRALGPKYYGFVFAGSCGGCNIFEFAPHVWASGGDVLSGDGKKAMMDSSQVTDALTFYHDMWEAGVMPSSVKNDAGTVQTTAFSSGKVGMTNLGAFAVSTFEKAKVPFATAPIPGKDGGTASFAGGDEIAIPSGSKNKAGGQDFIKWATGEQAQTILAKAGIVPVRTDLVDKIYTSIDPRYKAFGEGMSNGKTPYSVNENAIINDNNGPWAKMINTAVFGGDIEGAQAAAQKSAQSLLDEGQ